MANFQQIRRSPCLVSSSPGHCRTALATQPSVFRTTESGHRNLVCAAAPEPTDAAPLERPAPTGASQEAPPEPQDDELQEVVKFEGSSARAELILSCLLGFSLLYLKGMGYFVQPLTLASIGRFLWFRYKLTDRRIILEFNSPIRKKTVQVAYDKVKEVRAVGRGFGLWGDMVIFLKDGSKLELVAVEDHVAIRVFLEGNISL